MICKKGSTFSRGDFIEKEPQRSGASGSWVVAYSAIKVLDVFAKEYDYNNIDEYLLCINAELKRRT